MKRLAVVLLLAVAAPIGAAQPVAATGAGPTRSLSDVARERKLVKPTGAGTFSVTGASGMPVLVGPVQDAAYWANRAETVRREAFWSDMSRSLARVNEPPTPVYWFNGGGRSSYHTQPSRSVGHAAPAPRSQDSPHSAARGGGRTTSGRTR